MPKIVFNDGKIIFKRGSFNLTYLREVCLGPPGVADLHGVYPDIP